MPIQGSPGYLHLHHTNTWDTWEVAEPIPSLLPNLEGPNPGLFKTEIWPAGQGAGPTWSPSSKGLVLAAAQAMSDGEGGFKKPPFRIPCTLLPHGVPNWGSV